MKHKYRLLTRNSQLALWQAKHVQSLLRASACAPQIDIISMTTEGDQNLTDRLAKVGGKGLFIGNLEQALQTGEGDFSVHSYKDVPVSLNKGFVIAAVLPRGHVADALVSNKYTSLDDLPQGAKVGTSSLRRMSQLLHYRPDLQIVPMRGNLNTRLAKLDGDVCDALVLARAGLERLGAQQRIAETIAFDIMLPAVAQGALAIETIARHQSSELLQALACSNTTAATQAERAFARALHADCSAPVAAHAVVADGKITLTARIIAHDGAICLERCVSSAIDQAEILGSQVANALVQDGGADVLAAAKSYIANL